MSLNGLGCQAPGTFGSSLPVVSETAMLTFKPSSKEKVKPLAQRKG